MDICNKTELKKERLPFFQKKQTLAAIYNEMTNTFFISNYKYANFKFQSSLYDKIAFNLRHECVVELKLVYTYGFLTGHYVVNKHADSIVEGESIYSLLETSFPREFSYEVLKEVEHLLPDIPQNIIEKELMRGRVDLRSLPFVTIDGEETKDFDDAVYANLLANGNVEVFVAIADVSYYVKPNTELDKEALKRGCSLYLSEFMVSMLPEILSTSLCSLVPHKDRFALTLRAIVDSETGDIIKYNFMNAIVQSKHRLTYSNVNQAIASDYSGVINEDLYHKIINPLELATKFRLINKQQRGAISFNKDKFKVSIGKSIKVSAYSLIEEMMVLSNILAASALEPYFCLYRSHEKPDSAKIFSILNQLEKNGVYIDTSRIKDDVDVSLENKIIREIDRTLPNSSYMDDVLKTMKRAFYGAQNKGHFALGLEKYTHFTSPIRRYPDVMIHRLLKYHVIKYGEGMHHYNSSEISYIASKVDKSKLKTDKAQELSVKRQSVIDFRENINKVLTVRAKFIKSSGIIVTFIDEGVDSLVTKHDLEKKGFYYSHLTKSWNNQNNSLSLYKDLMLKVRILSCDVIYGKIKISYVALLTEEEKIAV